MGGKFKFESFGNVGNTAFILSGEKEGFTDYQSGVLLEIGDTFTIDAVGDKFENDIYFTIYDPVSAATLQVLKWHTSCSEPIIEGEDFGAIRLVGYLDKESTPGDECGFGGLTFDDL